MLNRLMNELRAWVDAALAFLPGGLGVRLRTLALGGRFASSGRSLRMETGVRVLGWENIRLGDDVTFRRNCEVCAEDGELVVGDRVGFNTNVYLGASGGRIWIGDDVIVAPNVVLRASDHRYDDLSRPIRDQGHRGGTIRIGSGVWLAANCVILKDVTVGDHAIVAAGAVVTSDVAPYSIVGGVPARQLSVRQ